MPGFFIAMTKETEYKLYGAIDILESALNALCCDPRADVSCRIATSRDLVRESIIYERKMIDGNTEHPHHRTQTG